MPENNPKNIDDLIVCFLSGEATPEEQMQLLQWLESANDNQVYYAQMRDAWLSSAQVGRLATEQIKTALNKVHKRTAYTPVADKKEYRTQKSSWPRELFKYAAAIALLAVVAYGFSQYYITRWINQQSSEIVYEAHYGSRAYTVLPDSSRVWLNSGSTLTFRSDYNLRDRQVHLTGEAYFEVQTNPGKPFMVKAGGLNIKATGTSFNVKAYPEENQVTTTLVEGIVIVEGKDPDRKDFKVRLSPSQSVCYYKQPEENKITNEAAEPIATNELKALPVISQVRPEIHTSWTSNRWIIEKESFGNLAVKLERRYDVAIQFDSEKLKKYHFSGIIEHETLEQIFHIFRYTIPLRYTINKGVVTLTVDEELEKNYEKAWK